MPKKVFNVDDLFSPEEQPKKVVPPVVPVVEEAASSTNVSGVSASSNPEQTPAVQTISTEQTQNKQVSKKTSKQVKPTGVKCTKHTFEIPDDIWGDIEILLFALGKKKQNQFIAELLLNAVETNKELIKRYK